MSPIPSDGSLDSTFAFLSEGYAFISNRCRRLGSDVFETRLMLRRAICMQGEEAARVFYTEGRFTRRGALPRLTLLLLQDKGSVATLDGEAHHHRKRMFMSLMGPDSRARLIAAQEEAWYARIGAWEEMNRVVLLREAQEILCRAACRWAGVPLPEPEVARRAREFSVMVDGAGAFGPQTLQGMMLRARTERWIRDLVARLRAGEITVAEGSPADVIARHRGPSGAQLDTKVAAVEIINLLRPIVAVGRFVAFAALALHRHPAWRERIAAGGNGDVEHFVQEVRRFYPFFPAVAGRAREAFEWRGHRFAEGDWVILDLYGTNHDERIWSDPGAFRPERFQIWNGSAFNFIPQGGGDHFTNHRCAGEWATIELMKSAVRLLVGAMRYEVPAQDLQVDLARMPAQPRSGFIISQVRRAR